MDFQKLTKDLIKAKQNALTMVGVDDGGTCNFDTFVLLQKNINYNSLKEAISKAGLHVSKWSAGHYHIYGYEMGQANRRTTMVEMFEKTMRELGYNTTIYYAMD